MQPIQALGPLLPPSMISGGNAAGPVAPTAAGGPTFKELLLSSLERASGATHGASQASSGSAASGETKPVAAGAALHEAQAALQTATQIRDALLGAYHEIKDLRI